MRDAYATGCSQVIDITGMRFERLTVVSRAGKKTSSRNHFWKVICDCGTEKEVNGSHLRSGVTKSCGCLKKEKARLSGDRTRTHGMCRTSIYSIWDSMIQRCTNTNRKDFKTYGEAGITVCERWMQSFEMFLADMGNRPDGMSIDRIDVAKGYEPGNCKWATSKEQSRNRTVNKMLTFNGQTKCLQDWSEITGINKVTLQSRIARKWSNEKSLTTPIQIHKKG